MKKVSLDELQERARLITKEKLRQYEIPEEATNESLYLEIGFNGDERIFYLCFFDEKKRHVVSQTTLNVFTGKGTVEIFLPKIREKKSKLRKSFLKQQKSLSNSENRERSLQIKERFFEHFDLEDVEVLHLFLSIAEKGEVDTSSFFDELRRRFPNIKTVVPRVDFERDVLEHLEIDSRSELKVNHWGIAEPVGDELVGEKEIDLVLVPMLCFDERGFRVGHGKGFYDKFLSLCRSNCLKVGLSFFEPIAEISDVHEFDVKLDYCVTPEKIYRFSD